jgi:hypothetical protein
MKREIPCKRPVRAACTVRPPRALYIGSDSACPAPLQAYLRAQERAVFTDQIMPTQRGTAAAQAQ